LASFFVFFMETIMTDSKDLYILDMSTNIIGNMFIYLTILLCFFMIKNTKLNAVEYDLLS
jgi:hypothetical protein